MQAASRRIMQLVTAPEQRYKRRYILDDTVGAVMLTDTQVRSARAAEKPYKLFDGAGLYLFVRPTGSRQWRYDYHYAGKRKTLTIGSYPDTSLFDARRARDEAKLALRGKKDPTYRPGTTFGEVAQEWLRKLEREGDAAITTEKKRWLLSFTSDLTKRPITEITAPDLLQILRRVEAPGRYESARRLRSVLSRIFRYAIATARAERDPAEDLRGALVTPSVTHRAAFTATKDIAGLLRAVDAYSGAEVTKYALQMAAYTFVRPGELRHAEWAEFDTDWRIPAAKMKMKQPHIVPLSTQVLAILEELRPLTGHAKYLFPSFLADDRPMSENTMNSALRRLGFSKEEMTSHGFRTIGSTLLNELGWNPDAIERQLAHKPKDAVRAAYNQAQHLSERQRMMQAWADYLDNLKTQE